MRSIMTVIVLHWRHPYFGTFKSISYSVFYHFIIIIILIFYYLRILYSVF